MLIELFEEMPKRMSVRGQVRGRGIQDKAYRYGPARKRVRRGTGEEGTDLKQRDVEANTDQRKPHVVRTELDEFLKENPWPCSPQKGFQHVDLKTPCRGWFQLVQQVSRDSIEMK